MDRHRPVGPPLVPLASLAAALTLVPLVPAQAARRQGAAAVRRPAPAAPEEQALRELDSVGAPRRGAFPFLLSFPRRSVPPDPREEGSAGLLRGRGPNAPGRPHAPLPGSGPEWEPIGPGPAVEGQVENVAPGNETTGAVHVVLAHPTDPDVLYVAATNGGVWRTREGRRANPVWEPLADRLPALSIGALAMDPTNPRVLIAGVGRVSSLGLVGGSLAGLYVTRDGGDTWRTIDDPFVQGNVSGLAVRGDFLLAGLNSFGGFFPGQGLVRSLDGGGTWEPLGPSRGFPEADVLDLVADPGVPGLVYASVIGLGIFASEDFGDTWTDVSANDAELHGIVTDFSNNNLEMAVHPRSGRLYADVILDGQTFYLGYTDDRGATWTRMDLPGTFDGPMGTVLDATNATPIVVTVAGFHGLSDGDRVQVSDVQGNLGANGAFFVDARSGSTFALEGSAGTGDYAGGGVWGEISGLNPGPEPGSQGFLHASIAVDSGNDDLVYVGGDRQELFSIPNSIGAFDYTGRLFRGDASAQRADAIPTPQWAHLTHLPTADVPEGGTLSSSAPHADSREMALDAAGDLLEGDDGGVYRRTSPRTNAGDWVSLVGNLQVMEYHDLAYDSVSNVVLGGAQDTGTTMQASESGPTFFTWIGGDGGKVAVDDRSFPDMSIRYTSAQFLIAFNRSFWDANNQLLGYEFPDLQALQGPPISADFYTPVAVNEVAPERLVFLASNGVFESLDRGDTVQQVSDMRGQFLLEDCVVAGGRSCGEDAPDVLVVGSQLGLFLRSEAMGPFEDVTPFPGFLPRDVCVDPEDWHTMVTVGDDLVRGGQGVWASRDGGSTWEDVTGFLSLLGAQTARTIAFVPGARRDLVVVGTIAGAYVTFTDCPGVWAPLGARLPNVRMQELDYDVADDVLVVGTLGRGAWKLRDASRAAARLARLDIDDAEVRSGGFRLRGRFALEPDRRLDPDLENVVVVLGDYAEAVSMGSFRAAGKGLLRYDADGPGITEIKLKREGRFEVRAEGVDPGVALPGPVVFSLQLGNDFDALDLSLDRGGDLAR